jgi:hypothetical protein
MSPRPFSLAFSPANTLFLLLYQPFFQSQEFMEVCGIYFEIFLQLIVFMKVIFLYVLTMLWNFYKMFTAKSPVRLQFYLKGGVLQHEEEERSCHGHGWRDVLRSDGWLFQQQQHGERGPRR